MRSRLLRLGVGLPLATVAVTLAGCTPDTTRGRVERDFSQTFSNQYAQSLQRQGKPVAHPRVLSTTCHNGSNTARDAGPGSWSCEIKYVAPDGKKHDDVWLLLSDALSCYQAFTTDDALRYHKIRDVYSHKLIYDPAGGFDGCLNPYSGPKNTSKK